MTSRSLLRACPDILEFYGLHVITANNGADAVTRILQSKSTVDLVITDLMMPSMDGLAAAEAIRKIAFRTKLVAMSGSTSEISECQTSIEFAAVPSKSFTSIELIRILEKDTADDVS